VSIIIEKILAGILLFFTNWGTILHRSLPDSLKPLTTYLHATVALDMNELLENPRKTLNGLKADQITIVTTPESSVLRYSFMLPISARNDLKNVIALEANRVLPINPALLDYGWAVEKVEDNHLVCIHIAVLRKSTMEEVRQRIRHYNIPVYDFVLPRSSKGPKIRFSIPEITKFKIWPLATLSANFIFMMFLLSVLPDLYRTRLQNALQDTEIKIEEMRQATSTIASLQSKIQTMESVSGLVESYRQSNLTIPLFETLTKASPDHVVLQDIQFDRNKLFLTGTSSTPEQWALSLEAHKSFHDVRLTSVFDQEANDRRRFEIRMRYSNPLRTLERVQEDNNAQ
jgi:Tfp pilus assembly protein PilN